MRKIGAARPDFTYTTIHVQCGNEGLRNFNAETKAYVKSLAPRDPILPTQRYMCNAETKACRNFNAETKAYVKSAPRDPILPTQRYTCNAETPSWGNFNAETKGPDFTYTPIHV